MRAGDPDATSFDADWKAASDTMASRLRARCGPDSILVGNCGSGAEYARFHGWTRENCPFRQGGTNIYRRDFLNGTVLVNPAARAFTVPLKGSFRKIHGIMAPAVNDGSRVTVVTVPPSDAHFLLGQDSYQPAGPRDLRIVRWRTRNRASPGANRPQGSLGSGGWI